MRLARGLPPGGVALAFGCGGFPWDAGSGARFAAAWVRGLFPFAGFADCVLRATSFFAAFFGDGFARGDFRLAGLLVFFAIEARRRRSRPSCPSERSTGKNPTPREL